MKIRNLTKLNFKANFSSNRLEESKLKNIHTYLVAFLIPVIVMLLIFIQRGIYPFGDQCFLRTDLYHQYAPFYRELNRVMHRFGSFFQNYSVGLSSNYLSLIAYYLASPINILLILCPENLVIEFITVWIVLKIALSSLCMAIFLGYKTGRKDISLAFFGSFYGLSGYMAAYSWNIMWLDCIFLFPLIIMGLDRLIKENKCFMYTLTLAFCIYSNYYISIMVCLSLVLYFTAMIFVLPKDKVIKEKRGDRIVCSKIIKPNYAKRVFNFCVFSLLAGCLAAVMLVPEVLALSLTASADTTFPQTVTQYFSIIKIISRHLTLVQIHTGLDHWPNIFCGIAVLFFVPLFVMNKKIALKEKIAFFVLITIYYLSFSINVLNYIWHGFHFPNSLPARMSFIYVFLIITMAYLGFDKVKERSKSELGASFWISIAIILIAQNSLEPQSETFYSYKSFLVSTVFVSLYALITYLFVTKKARRITVVYIAAALTIIENTWNTSATSVSTVSRSEYIQLEKPYNKLLETFAEDGFYRIEEMDLRTKNDSAWYGYNSTSIFSSVANRYVGDFYSDFGLEASTNAYSFSGSTPLMASILNVKYLFRDQNDSIYPINEKDASYTFIGQSLDGSVTMYENPYALSLGFLVPDGLEENMGFDSFYPAEIQNNFVHQTAGVGDILEAIGGYADNEACSFQGKIDEDGHYYAFISNTNIKKVTATIGDRTTNFDDVDRGFMLDLGWCNKDEAIYISSTEDTFLNASVYKWNQDNYEEAMKTIMTEGHLEVTEYTDTMITGSINASSDKTLLITLPDNDAGWHLFIDNVEVETQPFDKAFISVHLPSGYHDVVLKYKTPGLFIGAAITITSTLLFVMMVLVSRTRKRSGEAAFSYPKFLEDIEINSGTDDINIETVDLDNNASEAKSSGESIK